jgi:hypothetical protein
MKRLNLNGVIDDLRLSRAEFRKSGAYLNRSIPFDGNLSLDNKYKAVADKLFIELKLDKGYIIEQKKLDLQILLANLFYQTRRPISISLSPNSWKHHLGRYNKSSYFTVALLHVLKNKNLITMNKGYLIEERSRLTRISATKKLIEYCPEMPLGIIWDPKELVILHDEKGRLKDYKDTAETWRVRSILKLVNKVNSEANIVYRSNIVKTYLRAIYNVKLTWYGRLHTKGYQHYQGLTGEERKKITINGNSVVELDYRALHPYLLYAEEGIQYNGDPYSIVDPRPELRQFLKHILLCMLNAKDTTLAQRGANNWLIDHPEIKEVLNAMGVYRANPFMDKFLEVHSRIGHYFCKGKETGMKIMNKDAKIALDIVNHFAKKNIPILAIHDSFIVEKQYKTELLQVMKTAYKKHAKLRIKIH